MDTFVVFNEVVLRWAIDRAGVDPCSLKSISKNIDLLMNGKKKPTIRQAQNLAKKLCVPLGYFCLAAPPKDESMIPDFRTVGNRPPMTLSIDLRRTIEHAQYCQRFLSEFMERNDYLPFEHNNIIQESMDVQEAVKVLHELIEERKTGISVQESQLSLIRKIEQLGILVQRNGHVLNNNNKKLNPQEFRGFAICDKYVPLVFINTNDSRRASIFTLVHELTHILLGKSGISDFGTSNKTETFCDAVAAEYLVPGKKLNEFFSKNSEKDNDLLIKDASKKFSVSQWVILRRATELGLVDYAYYKRKSVALFNFYNQQKTTGFIKYNDAQVIHLGKKLVDAAVISAYAGDITFREASRLTFLNQSAIAQKAQSLSL